METNQPLRIGITMGDVNGIGTEVLLNGLADKLITDICTPVIFGSPKVLGYYRKLLNINEFSYHTVDTPSAVVDKRINLIPCVTDDVRVELGKPTEASGALAVKFLDAATEALKAGTIDGLVTLPINKQTVQSDSFTFTGHTEYFNHHFGKDTPSMMLMLSDVMRLAILTGHAALRDVPTLISKDLICSSVRMLNTVLLEDFGINKAKIAVLSLNPHCGDGGLLGSEEADIISPAIEELKNEGLFVFGPYSADGFFGSSSVASFDAVLGMYHDQVMSPFKALAFSTGVNYTAGVSIVRTSPAHGTGYDIVGKGKASSDSFRQAIYYACDIIRKRREYTQLMASAMKS